MYIARSLLKNVDIAAQREELQFREFRLFQPESTDCLPEFSGLDWDDHDWFYERQYSSIPPAPDPGAYGRISYDFEDTMLLLRLFRAGDIAFSPLRILKPDGSVATQDPYRTATEITSTSWYPFADTECSVWDTFADAARASPAWSSAWFRVVRRFFLYGSSKELNARFQYVDRFVDYAVALEAALAPEQDFSSRRVRERAAAIIGGTDDRRDVVRSTIRFVYDLRSTIGHGRELSPAQQVRLETEEMSTEQAVRDVLLATLIRVPPNDPERREFLAAIWDVPSDARTQKVTEDLRALSDSERQRVLTQFRDSPPVSRSS